MFKIVADSSSDVFQLSDVAYAHVPLKIISLDKEYVDTPELKVFEMLEEIKATKSATSTSCPNAYEWKEAFGGADGVFAVTITSNLSGSCNAAMQAREEYLRKKQAASDERKKQTLLTKLRREAETLEGELGQIEEELFGSAAADYVRAAELETLREEKENRLLEIYEEIGV